MINILMNQKPGLKHLNWRQQKEKPKHIWGYYVCLCPIKGTPGLYELREAGSVG